MAMPRSIGSTPLRRAERQAFSAFSPRPICEPPLPCVAQINTVGPIVVPPRYALARGRVRHFGDPVALIIAETCDLARDAAERIAAMGRPQPPLMARCDPTP